MPMYDNTLVRRVLFNSMDIAQRKNRDVTSIRECARALVATPSSSEARGRAYQSLRLAMSAPSRSALNFAHNTVGWTSVV